MFQNTLQPSLQIDAVMALKYPAHCRSPQKLEVLKLKDEQFFSFIRNRKYKQAYVMGLDLLSKGHKNKSVATFCQYISLNLLNEPEEINQGQQQQGQVTSQSITDESSDGQGQDIEKMPNNDEYERKQNSVKKIGKTKQELKGKEKYRIKTIKKERKTKVQIEPQKAKNLREKESIQNIVNIEFNTEKTNKNQEIPKFPTIRTNSTGKQNNQNFDNLFKSEPKSKKPIKKQFLGNQRVKFGNKWSKNQYPLLGYHKALKI